MIKLRESSDDKGWKALEEKLRQQGVNESEIRHAESSFRDGLEILKGLFLATCSFEKCRKREK